MNYLQFRDFWHAALQAAHIPIPYPLGPTERIDLNNMSRSYELILYGGSHPKSEPFHSIASIAWVWDILLSARNATTEEDMLMTLYGEHGLHEDTEIPYLRIDVNLTASVPYGENFPMPTQSQWQRWVKGINFQLQEILPTLYDGDLLVCACTGEPEATVKCLEDGQLSLDTLTFAAWQMISLPRQWDDPQKCDPDPTDALTDFTKRIAKAITVWQDNLVHLAGNKTR